MRKGVVWQCGQRCFIGVLPAGDHNTARGRVARKSDDDYMLFRKLWTESRNATPARRRFGRLCLLQPASVRLGACAQSHAGFVPLLVLCHCGLRYGWPMDTVIALGQLRDHDHLLHAYCHVCDRWRVLNLEQMLSQWRGMACAPDEVQCTACGQMGRLKIRRRLAQRVEHEPAAVAGGSFAV